MDSLFNQDQYLLSPPLPSGIDRNLHFEFQTECTIPVGIKKAILRFYAANLTEIFFNGKSIHMGPCRSCPPRRYYDEIVFEPTPGNALFRFHQCVENIQQEPGILCELELVTETKTIFLLQKKEDYRVRIMSAYAWDVPRNFGTGYAEHVNIKASENEFGMLKQGMTLLSKQHFYSRPIPNFKERARSPRDIRQEADGSILLDFASIVFGRSEIDAQGKGDVVIEYIEALEGGWISPQGTIVMYSDKILNVNGSFHWKGFHKRAFRYVRLRNVSSDQLSFCVQEYNYPLEQIGSFNSSDEFLNRLAKISTDTLAVCMDDIYNDCPHRDQAQWMDAFASAQAALGLFGVSDLTRKCLIQYALCSCRNGRIVSPSITGRSSFIDYVLTLYRFVQWYYHCSGDRSLVEEVYDALAETLRRFYTYESSDHLLDHPMPEPDIVYLDNTFELPKKGKSTALNALYLGALDSMVEFASVLGRKDDADEFLHRSQLLQKAIHRGCAHPTIPACFRDNAQIYDLKFTMVNFSCELGKWSGSCGVLEFAVDVENATTLKLEYAVYDNVRIYLNGKLLCFDPSVATWRDQPMYEAQKLSVDMQPGSNHFRFEVKSNSLNWELFFRFEGEPLLRDVMISECDWNTGEVILPGRPLHLRSWIPPELSQSTQAYCAISNVHFDKEKNRTMLRNVIRDSYPRSYLSVRVPYFCEENNPPCVCNPWVMPANTPWSTFFLLSALFDNGLEDDALKIIRHYWKKMLDSGAVNTWEEWGMNSSLCHAWGAVPAYFMQRHILGIHHDTLCHGYILLRPQLFELDFAEGNVALKGGGNIYVRLERKNNNVILTLQAPSEIPIKLELDHLHNFEISLHSEFTLTNHLSRNA